LVIVLTKDEKRTFYGFLGLYLGSSLLLIAIISWLFYASSSNQLEELTISKMEITASDISHKIIQAHMKGENLNLQALHVDKNFKYALYNKEKKPIYVGFKEKVDFEQKSFTKNNSIFYVDRGTTGHLAVSYVIIKENSLSKSLLKLKHNIIYATIGIYLIIALVGFSLAKLFIYPIQSQREKLNTFIKDTTHELNTPLSALLLCTSSENFHTEQNKEHIRLSAKKISNLYKDLTYLTLKEHQKSVTKTIDISEILKEELSYHSQLSLKKKITITHSLEKTLFNIDKEDFIRVTNNLLSNAIKYTKRNGKINITLKNSILTIQDNGIGIEKDKLDKIYERYYRATSNVGGFGIGLNIVYSICKNYSVKVDVESKLNEGTTFKLIFPH
jgi:two-component system OmpR family sensor kinase